MLPQKEKRTQMAKQRAKLTTNWLRTESLMRKPWRSSSTSLADLTSKHTPHTDMLSSGALTTPSATSETSSASRRMTNLVDHAWWSVAQCARHSWCSPWSLPWWSLLSWRHTTDSWRQETLLWMPNTRLSICVKKSLKSPRLLPISPDAPKNAKRSRIENLRLRWKLRRRRLIGRWKKGRRWKITQKKEISEKKKFTKSDWKIEARFSTYAMPQF